MRKVLITGCAGFIGCHLAMRFLRNNWLVTGVDNLSRNGSSANLEWLNSHQGKNFLFFKEDIRNFSGIEKIFKDQSPFELVIHEAAQVAVTTSVSNPREDFEINALGTFNILEGTRLYSPEAFLEFASTNKVYGKMAEIGIVEKKGKYLYETLKKGIKETYCLDFYSPYGCSKGAADQYVRDYGRIYGLKTVVLRQSCIYGTRQFGVEDQGWIAWFVIASLLGKPITIYGDGKQSRDVLWIDDLVEIYVKLFEHKDTVSGEVFNVGGGSRNVLSLLELVDYLKREKTIQRDPKFADWRPGDQKTFVSDITKISKAIHWKPTVSPRQGLEKIFTWAKENKTMLEKLLK